MAPALSAPAPAAWQGRLLPLKGSGSPADAALAQRIIAGERATVLYETAEAALGQSVAQSLRTFAARVAKLTWIWFAVFLPTYVGAMFLHPYGSGTHSIAASVAAIVLGCAAALSTIVFVVLVVRASKDAGLGPCFNLRTELRRKYGIPGSRFNDCCAVTWCGPCALAQLARTVARQEAGADAV